jgi:4-amino-4-deoxy-L-arabinose transferase-like glycosyltransferase
VVDSAAPLPSDPIVRFGVLTCLLLLVVRLLTLPFPDLVDSTEGRYAAAALTMIERGEYLTPWIDMGGGPEPYLGKPPMHFWLTIGCFKVFGVSALSARLPSFFATMICAGALFWFAHRLWGARTAVLSTLFYLSSGLTFFLAGVALLDTTLMLFVTAAIVLFGGFYLCGLNIRPRLTAVLVGLMLGAAFLTKGPVSIAIFLAAVLPWALIHHEEVLRKKFPLVVCLTAFIACTAPWYIACELRHPGFLYYFIVQENYLRIVAENYGDRYGTGHPQIFGTSILHAFLCFMPWSIALLTIGVRKWRSPAFSIREALRPVAFRQLDPLLLYAATWSLSMPLFLLLTSQYTANYLAPIMPGMALLLGGLIGNDQRTSEPFVPGRFLKTFFVASGVVFAILPIIGAFFQAPWWIIPVSWSGLVGLVLVARLGNLNSRGHLLFRVTGGLALLYCVVILSFSAHISARRSTGEVIALLRSQSNLPVNREIRVGFVGQLPFSSAVYGAIKAPRVQISEVSEIGCCGDSYDFYISSIRAIREGRTVPSTVSEVGRTKKWVLFFATQKSPSSSS